MDPTFQYAGPNRLPRKEFLLQTRLETFTRDTVNAKQFEHWQTDGPDFRYVRPNLKIKNEVSTNNPYMDMAPQNTRLEVRDFRQSQPFEAGGPDLAHNVYFDRYDPITDPRNAIRELRSVVYEVKGGDRGSSESKHLLKRQFENRWCAEDTIDSESMNTLLRYELINQK
jgi:hypothetical protein